MSQLLFYPVPTEQHHPSLFQSVSDTNPVPVTLQQVFALIRDDATLEALTQQVRQLATANAKTYAKAKAQLPAISPAASLLGGHAAKHIVGLTGLGMVDFDHLDPDELPKLRAAVNGDPHTLLSHVTPSGHGLRILFRYQVSGSGSFSYTEAFAIGNEYFRMVTGHDFDPAVKDPTRLSFLCHDADAYLNPDAAAFTLFSQEAKQAQESAPDTPVADRLQLAWNLSTRANHRFVDGHRHAMLIDLARLHCKLGIPASDSLAYLAPLAPRGEREAKDIVRWCYDRFSPTLTQSLSHNYRGNDKATPNADAIAPQVPAITAKTTPKSEAKQAAYNQIGQWLTAHYDLRYNEVRHLTEYRRNDTEPFLPITELVRNSMIVQCSTDLGKHVRGTDFDTVLHSDIVQPYNPFHLYLDSLAPYDPAAEPDYIAQLCSHVHTTSDPAFFLTYFRKWFVSLLPTMLDPAVTNQVVLIFTGPQGCYKSTFFRLLLPPELRGYFLAKSDTFKMDKDSRLALSEYALVCLEEIGSLTRRELDDIKGLITQTDIVERAPYEHTKESRPHIASLCGTSNHTELFGDITGLRRWLAFEIRRIDTPSDALYNHDRLFAQAYHLWQHGFRYWFDNIDIANLEEHMEQFKEVCLEEQQIRRYYRVPSDETYPQNGLYKETHTFVTVAEIMDRCNSGGLRNCINKNNIGRTMRSLGFKPIRRNGCRGYIVHCLTDADHFEESKISHQEDI